MNRTCPVCNSKYTKANSPMICGICGHAAMDSMISGATAEEEAWALYRGGEYSKAGKLYNELGQSGRWTSYWAALLCRLGVGYVQENVPAPVPTCCLPVCPQGMTEDQPEWQRMAPYINDADQETGKWFLQQKEALNCMLKAIHHHAADTPYDLFLCFPMKEKTARFAAALYSQLTSGEEQLHVFFAPKTLEGVREDVFEGILWQGLTTSKTMCIIPWPGEPLLTPWMMNEITRFQRMHPDSGVLVILLPGIQKEQLPAFLSRADMITVENENSAAEIMDAARKVRESLPDEDHHAELEGHLIFSRPEDQRKNPASIFSRNEINMLPQELSRFMFATSYSQREMMQRFREWYNKNGGIWNGKHLTGFVPWEVLKIKGKRYSLTGSAAGVVLPGMKLMTANGRVQAEVVSIYQNHKEKPWIASNKAVPVTLVIELPYEIREWTDTIWHSA